MLWWNVRDRFADSMRKIGAVIGRLGASIDMTELSQLNEWHTLVQRSGSVQKLVNETVDDDFPRFGKQAVRPAVAAGNIRGAISSQRAIPLGVRPKVVHPSTVTKEKTPHPFRRCLDMIEIYFFVADIGAQADEIVLVPCHIDQLELFEAGRER